jgi:hypothetical protein
MRIDEVSREWMLRAAHRLTARQHLRRVPLWSWVGQICCVGSGSAHTICIELGWNPHAYADRPLPESNAEAHASATEGSR